MLLLDDLLNTAPCGFLSLADDGTILTINRTLLELLGFSEPELQGHHVESILPVASRIFYQTHFFPLLLLNGRVEEVYFSVASKSKTAMPMLINAVRCERDGTNVTDCILVHMRQRDQYENEILKAKRIAEEATRDKDQFLAFISHDLRTPLSAILGWTQMLKSGELDEEMHSQALEVIERSVRSQSRLIEDLLDFSRIASGELRLDVIEVAPMTFIQAALDIIHPAVAAKQIKLQADLNPSTGFVSVDAERLQQVMWNLLSNAIKFTPERGHVQVGLKPVGSTVEITVRDTGQGISAEFLPHVFERFHQASSAATRRHSGLGLGMAITKHLVELHGGTIHAASPGEGQGATFTVSLPIASAEHASA